MFQDYFAQHPQLLIWPLIGLLIFLTCFVGVLIYIIVGLRDRDTTFVVEQGSVGGQVGEEIAPGAGCHGRPRRRRWEHRCS